MSDIPIPPEVVEAAINAFLNSQSKTNAEAMKDALLAALAAWPGARPETSTIWNERRHTDFILPLPQEPRT